MYPSVTTAWPAWATNFEGRLAYCYLDTKGLVTTGIGNLIDNIPAAQALPWLTADGQLATADQVAAEWRQIKARTSLAPEGGYAFRTYATLHLSDTTIDALLMAKTAQFWTRLLATLPNLETVPADAQLAILDEAWQNGPAYLDTKTAAGGYVWAGTRTAVLAQDWTGAASHVPGTGRRADARKRLFTNAAKVVAVGADPAVLWNTKTPTAPVAVVTVAPNPAPPINTPAPQEPTIKHNNTYGDYTWFRGGNIPPLIATILQAIPSPVTLAQGGLSHSVLASGRTHNGLGAYDINVKGWKKVDILKLCAELIRSGECAFPRGGLFGSAFFVQHVHVVSRNCENALHQTAKDQIDDFEHNPRRNGLVGHGRYNGPATPLGTWNDSPYNPANIRDTVGGTMIVISDTLQGLDIDRNPKAGKTQVKGYEIHYTHQVHRWGRWNIVTSADTYYAVADKTQDYLTLKTPTTKEN